MFVTSFVIVVGLAVIVDGLCCFIDSSKTHITGDGGFCSRLWRRRGKSSFISLLNRFPSLPVVSFINP